MKIVITAVGTRGDLQPYIALRLGLKATGNDLLLVSAKNEEEFVKSYGLNFFALDIDIEKLMKSGETKGMSKGDNPLKFIISHIKGSKEIKKTMVKTQYQIWEACQEADIIIYHPGMPLGFFIAKQLGKISILANPFPIIATKEYPSILFYTAPRLGKYFNILTHKILEKVFWAMTRSSIEKFWNEKVKSKMNFSISPIRQQVKSGMPVLNGYSRHLFHQPKDWANNIHTTGSWIIEGNTDFTPPANLVSFIKNDEIPIYIGFGSMNNIDNFETILHLIVNALQLSKVRAIVSLGWDNLNYSKPIPENIFLVKSVPHTWLFPQVKLVINHGGAGTTAAGLTDGKPTIVIPHNADQPAWGQRVYELKVGAKPIKKKKLTAKRLAYAISYALQPAIIANATALGLQIKKETGVKNAVKIIEESYRLIYKSNTI